MSKVGRGADPTSRRIIDMAIGVLIGWRGCSEREAFEEIASAVRETGFGIGSIADALVDLASGVEQSAPHHRAQALRVWGDAIPERSATLTAPPS
ncbi:putative RNA-binding protein (plasmid) [Mycolicibacterium chubuense NBB4]|uniref:Putative RNA-binding protein n=1 Tax=Mycolicibacterium chubuense (strain NBB4) TaxID=710421 RepID=I4BSD0_MYCCN|nr:ANTAR domain-containing protein [Mycolicibacterium chubuense]AFM20187.1 putative RNA-binding protein [Mycolicibacterium chubuense NBB4]